MFASKNVVFANRRRYLITDRATAESYVAEYLAKIAAGIAVADTEAVAGVLSVGDSRLKAIDAVDKRLIDFPYLSLSGRTDLVSAETKPWEKTNKPRSRAESPLNTKERRCTMLQALFTAQCSFVSRPKGVFIIHCEHGLHRSTAYFQAVVAHQLAQQITMDHFNNAKTDSDMELKLDKSRLVKSTRSIFYKAFDKPHWNAMAAHDVVRPYPRIVKVGMKLVMDMYDGLTPKLPPENRHRQVASRINTMFFG